MKITIDIPEEQIKKALAGIPAVFFLNSDHPVRTIALALKAAYEEAVKQRERKQ